MCSARLYFEPDHIFVLCLLGFGFQHVTLKMSERSRTDCFYDKKLCSLCFVSYLRSKHQALIPIIVKIFTLCWAKLTVPVLFIFYY